MNYSIILVLTVLLFGTGQFLVKLGSFKLNPAIVQALVAAASFVPAVLVILLQKLRFWPQGDNLSVGYSLLAGVFMGAAGMLSVFIYSKIPIHIVAPVFLIGSAGVASIAGIVLLNERVNPIIILGLLMMVLGAYLVIRYQ